MNKTDLFLLLILAVELVLIFYISIHITYTCLHVLDQFLRTWAAGGKTTPPSCL